MYEWSEQVGFHPWVGKNYENAPRKILLLGDSHYGDEADTDFTQNVIKHQIFEQKKRMRFFTCIIWTVFGNSDDIEDKFSMITFYNYVQTLMSASRLRPSDSDYKTAQKPFIEVLQKLLPDMVVTFGDAMTFHFPCIAEENAWGKDTVDEYPDVQLNNFIIRNRSIPVYSLPHPSGGKFNMRIYYQYFLGRGLTL